MRASAVRLAPLHVALLAFACARPSQRLSPGPIEAGPLEDFPSHDAALDTGPPPPPAPPDANASTSSALTPEVVAKLKTRHRAMCRCVASSVDPDAPGHGPYGVVEMRVAVPADGGAPAVTMDRATVESPTGAQWCVRAIVGAMRFGPQASDLEGPYRMVFDGHECEPGATR
jgi:hypothetical protein